MGSDVDGQATDELFGQSIALSADGLIFAAGGPGAAAEADGLARVYALDAGSATWVQMGADIAAADAGDNAGRPVAISADGLRVAVGSHKADPGGMSDAGHVRVFDYDGSDWQQLGLMPGARILLFARRAADGRPVAVRERGRPS